METVHEALEALDALDQIERVARDLHDSVCGPGAYLAERAESALHEDVAFGIRETVARVIGQAMLEGHRKTLERVAAKEQS